MKLLLAIALVIIGMPTPFVASAVKIGGGDIVFTPDNASPVVFSHDKHVQEKGLKCSNCHYRIFEMARRSYMMHMDRITKGDFCGVCHNGQKAFKAREKANCSRCHRNG